MYILDMKQDLLDPWREGDEFICLIPLASLCSVLGTLIVTGCSPNHTHLRPQIVLQKRPMQSNTFENVLMWSVVSIWNLVLVYGRDEKENSPVLGILYVFSVSQIFFPLKCGCEKQMFSKAQGLRNIHHCMVTQYLRVDTICSGKTDLFSHA